MCSNPGGSAVSWVSCCDVDTLPSLGYHAAMSIRFEAARDELLECDKEVVARIWVAAEILGRSCLYELTLDYTPITLIFM
jgi:hypothetical protein